MLDIKEIEYWISKLEKEDSSFQSYAKLADLYSIRDQMLGGVRRDLPSPTSTIPEASNGLIEPYGESEFLKSITGVPAADAWAVVDELMDTLQAVNVRLYDAVIRKLETLSRY